MLYYGVFWLTIGLVNIVVQNLWFGTDLTTAFLSAFPFFALYPILGASIWFIIKYNSLEEKDLYWVLLYHLIAGSLLNAIWLYLGFIFIKLVDESYLQILYDSLPNKIFSGYVMYTIYVMFFYTINYYQSLKEKIQKEAELKALIREAELNALKSQINPHFLFNSLNSIASLTLSAPEKAQEMVINLSRFMRYSLQHDQDEAVSLADELENIKLYLSIEKVRFGKKLNPVFDIEEGCHRCQIPNMILQPLFENAIKYGVYEATSPVSITTTCRIKEKHILICIENDYDPEAIRNRGEGIGLQNIRQRLSLIYGSADLLKLTDNKTSFKVELLLPKTIPA
ncbi:histidine kinase [uncultured Sunxiuqinia sp.]|uniref:sensor histidine kinase n=1 Tax=uncultured Sunxiuqinia sp. TaxID=1573825 RepID=UPI00262E07BA|nr:histidine kinase [uncultured Sunxiuqinia sp.]